MYLVVGLGNYGKDYVNTRHNAGFEVIRKIKELWSASDFQLKSKWETKISLVKKNGQSMLLALPQTYMNLSGRTIKKIIDYYHIPLNKIIIIYDDLDLEIGQYRITDNIFQGGHKGVKSIVNNLGGYNQFIRIKIGIEKEGGREKRGKISGHDFVLQKFTKQEKVLLKKIIPNIANDLEKIISQANKAAKY